MLLCLLLPAAVCAEGEAAQAPAKVIAGFEPLGDAGVITVPYKLALVTLEKEFPALYQQIEFILPDEMDRRVGQAVAAASLPAAK